MSPFWLLRMKRWVQNPPSPARVKLVLAVVTVCVLLVLIERTMGWPDWLTTEPAGRRPIY
jgi:hypothetical protein